MTKRIFEQTRLNSLDDDDLDLTEEEAENNLLGGASNKYPTIAKERSCLGVGILM